MLSNFRYNQNNITTGIKLNYQNDQFKQHLVNAISVIGTKLRFSKGRLAELLNNQIIFIDLQNLSFYEGTLLNVIATNDSLFDFYASICPDYYVASEMTNLLVVQGLHVIDDEQAYQLLESDKWEPFIIKPRANRKYI